MGALLDAGAFDPYPMFSEHPGLSLSVIELHVPDLWRLQRQEGLFVELPVVGIENYFPFDSITFPHDAMSRGYGETNRAYYYPSERSPLEERLQDYLRDEEHWAISHSPEWVEFTSLFPTQLTVEQTRQQRLYESAVEKAWTDLPDESDSSKSPSTNQSIQLKNSDALREEDAFYRFLREATGAFSAGDRSRPINVSGDAPEDSNEQLLIRITELTWNGMRWLPYSDPDIREVLVRSLNRVRTRARSTDPDELKRVEETAFQFDAELLAELGFVLPSDRIALKPPIQFEFAPGGSNGYQRGWCSPDLLERSLSDHAIADGRPWLRLQREGWHPLDIFDFEKFCSLLENRPAAITACISIKRRQSHSANLLFADLD